MTTTATQTGAGLLTLYAQTEKQRTRNTDMKTLPKIAGSPTARKEAHEARMRDKDYNFAVQAGLPVRGNWRKRANRERLYAEP